MPLWKTFILLLVLSTVNILIDANHTDTDATTSKLVTNFLNRSVDGYLCGVQKLRRRKRVIGGTIAKFGEFPWQAHIRISGLQCGSVLISQNFIATAAHCVHRSRLSEMTVYLGEHDTTDTRSYNEPLPEEIFPVTERIIHPKFNYMLTQPDRFDIALLRLNRRVTYKEHILPICLPKENQDFSGSIGTLAGWGKTDTSYGKTGSNILQKVTIPINITNRECRKWHYYKNIRIELHDEMFCAGHKNGKMDACLGDSGSPLVVLDNKKLWTLAGIVSAGFGCAVSHQPGVYLKVSKTVKWINKQIYA